jgi:ferredoxin
MPCRVDLEQDQAQLRVAELFRVGECHDAQDLLVLQPLHAHRLDIPALVAEAAGAEVFCCGPAGMMDAVSDEMTRLGRSENLHIERFSPTTQATAAAGDGFQVELVRSGCVVDVPPDQTVLEAVRAAGADAPSSCEMGICGTRETKVLSGAVDHRDDLLTDEEKAAGNTMLICVSRAARPRLVLDL